MTFKKARFERSSDKSGAFTFVFKTGGLASGQPTDEDDDAEIRIPQSWPKPTSNSTSFSSPSPSSSSSSSSSTPMVTSGSSRRADGADDGRNVGSDQAVGSGEDGTDESTPLGMFDVLPLEVLLQVLSFMDAPRLALHVGLINRTFRDLAEDDSLWRRFCSHSRTVQANMTVISLTFYGGKGDDGIRWKQVFRHLVRRCTCKRCGRTFRPLFNNEQACRYHTGKWKPSLTAYGDRWNCCRATNKLDPGCMESWHEDVCSWSGLF